MESITANPDNTKVTKVDYEKFCKEFIFEKLKGKSFGEAFCKEFGFNDIFLKSLSDDTAKYHIEKLGYISEK